MQERRRAIASGKLRFIGLVVLLTLLHWVLLVAAIPLFHAMDGWFWYFNYKPVREPWCLALLALTPALACLVLRMRKFVPAALLCVFLIGLCHQFGFAMLEGKGIEGLACPPQLEPV